MLSTFLARIQEKTVQHVREAAEKCRDGAKARVPVDTGRLQNSIRAEADGLSARVVTDCEYAAAVEFGTSRTPPRPFMRE